MSATLSIRGLRELAEQLRTLPDELTHEASAVVLGAANATAGIVRSVYGQHRVTGNLAKDVRVRDASSTSGGVVARVSSAARHANIFERGSVARRTAVHRKKPTPSGRGGNRGRMPAVRIFVPVAAHERALMRARLVELVRRHGLSVSDGG